MAGTWRKVLIKCPYYRTDDGGKINCEGLIADTYVSIRFPSGEALNRHAKKYCQDKWRECPYAEAVGRKYDET